MAKVWLAVPLLLCGACGHPEDKGPLKDPAPAAANEDAIPVGPLSGKLAGKAFTVHTARYFVDQRPGYEKVDIKLYAGAAPSACGDVAPEKPAEVWLRRKGPERLKAGTFTVDVEKGGPWEVHYQVHQDERWVGYGDANALFVITDVDPDLKVHGELSACFRDHTGSCVAGRFTANYCRITIDAPVRGTQAMERPPQKPLTPPAPPPSASAARQEEPKP